MSSRTLNTNLVYFCRLILPVETQSLKTLFPSSAQQQMTSQFRFPGAAGPPRCQCRAFSFDERARRRRWRDWLAHGIPRGRGLWDFCTDLHRYGFFLPSVRGSSFRTVIGLFLFPPFPPYCTVLRRSWPRSPPGGQPREAQTPAFTFLTFEPSFKTLTERSAEVVVDWTANVNVYFYILSITSSDKHPCGPTLCFRHCFLFMLKSIIHFSFWVFIFLVFKRLDATRCPSLAVHLMLRTSVDLWDSVSPEFRGNRTQDARGSARVDGFRGLGRVPGGPRTLQHPAWMWARFRDLLGGVVGVTFF